MYPWNCKSLSFWNKKHKNLNLSPALDTLKITSSEKQATVRKATTIKIPGRLAAQKKKKKVDKKYLIMVKNWHENRRGGSCNKK